MVTVYQEKQKFGQWWLWSLLAALFFFSAISFTELNELALNTESFVTFILSLILIVLFAILRLDTKISPSEISIKYYPFFKRKLNWEDIESAELVDYGFVGGWGIRLTRKYGTVYNTQGSKGLLVKLKNGKKLIIGTQKESEVKAYLNQLAKPV